MALATAVISFDISDLVGAGFDASKVRAWTTTNADNNRLLDTAANLVRVGDGKATVNNDGTGSFDVWVPGPDGNPTSWQQSFIFEYPLPGARGRTQATFGPYTISGSANLADLEAQQAIPPTYISEVTGALTGYVDDAADSAAAAAASAASAYDISNISTSDGVVSTLVADPDSDTAVALATSIAGVTYATVYGRKVGFLGDSITHGGDNNTATQRNNSPSMAAMLYSDGRWEYGVNAGVDGDTGAQMLARVQADIIDKGCNVCVLAFGSNAETLTNQAAALAGIHQALAAAGVQLVLATMPPVFDRLGDVSRTNAMFRRYAATHGLPVADQHAAVTDVATGQWKTGYSDDGVHPVFKARPLMGKAIDDALRSVIPAGSAVRLVDHALDPRDGLAGAGLFLGARNTGQPEFIPLPWDDFTGTGAGSVYSVENGTGPVLGKWAKLVVADGLGANYLYRDIALTAGPGFAVGEQIQLTGRFKGDGGLASVVQMRFVNSGGSDVAASLYPFNLTDNLLAGDGFNGVWSITGTIPASTHHMQLLLGFHGGGAGASGTASVAQVGLWNLTRDLS